jgi:hypothetical protein
MEVVAADLLTGRSNAPIPAGGIREGCQLLSWSQDSVVVSGLMDNPIELWGEIYHLLRTLEQSLIARPILQMSYENAGEQASTASADACFQRGVP